MRKLNSAARARANRASAAAFGGDELGGGGTRVGDRGRGRTGGGGGSSPPQSTSPRRAATTPNFKAERRLSDLDCRGAGRSPAMHFVFNRSSRRVHNGTGP